MSEPLSKLDNQQGHYSLIRGFGRYFAAQAWEGYIHYKQRGAMVMILPEVKVLGGTPPLYETSLKYAPEGSDLLKDLGVGLMGAWSRYLENLLLKVRLCALLLILIEWHIATIGMSQRIYLRLKHTKSGGRDTP